MAPTKCPKRSGIAPTSPLKKMKFDSDVEKKCAIVLEAIGSAPNVPSDVAQMFEITLPLSLGVCRDQRHKYQSKVVDAIAKVVNDIGTDLSGHVFSSEAQAQQANDAKEAKVAAVAEAHENLASRYEAERKQKEALAESAVAFREARNGLRLAEKKQQEYDAQANEAAGLLLATESASKDLVEPLQLSGVPEEEAAAKRTKLLTFLSKDMNIDESLMTALPAALEKAPESRGPFDILAIAELESVLAARVAELGAQVAAAAPTKAEHVEAVAESQSCHDAMAEAMRASADVFRTRRAEQEACNASLLSCKQAVKDAQAELQRISRNLEKSSRQSGKFKEGAYSAFASLRDRSAGSEVDELSSHVEDEAETQPVVSEAVDITTPTATDRVATGP